MSFFMRSLSFNIRNKYFKLGHPKLYIKLNNLIGILKLGYFTKKKVKEIQIIPKEDLKYHQER